MPQGDFSKQETRETEKALCEIFDALSKKRQTEFMGHLNDICLFLRAAEAAAPDEKEE